MLLLRVLPILLLAALTCGCRGGASQLVASSPSRDLPLEFGPTSEVWGAAGGLRFYEHRDADFRLAAEREDWDRVERVELGFASREPLQGRVEALIGGHIFSEERDWTDGPRRILFDTVGFGVDLGAMIYPFEGAGDRALNIGLGPWVRGAVGWCDGDFVDLEASLPGGGIGSTSGDLADLRFDLGVGLDLRAVIARSMVIGVGGGWNSWRATSGAAGTTKDGGGVIVVEDDDFRLSGSETFLRFTLEFYW